MFFSLLFNIESQLFYQNILVFLYTDNKLKIRTKGWVTLVKKRWIMPIFNHVIYIYIWLEKKNHGSNKCVLFLLYVTIVYIYFDSKDIFFNNFLLWIVMYMFNIIM